MNAVKIQHTLGEIERNMTELAPHRPLKLFNEFLVKGYTAVTLSSVPRDRFSDLLRAKICVGTMITLYDDFADRPVQYDPGLLECLYQLRFGHGELATSLNPQHRRVIAFAQALFAEMEAVLVRQPHYRRLRDILNFDLAQFYSANQYSSLLTADPRLHNALENRLYAHHNMGMVLVATMDLMASEKLDEAELGAMREVFVMGQRLGRIFNLLATRRREALDGDVTGELAACMGEREMEVAEDKLRGEIRLLRRKIAVLSPRVTSFSVGAYLEGLRKVQALHERMEGLI